MRFNQQDLFENIIKGDEGKILEIIFYMARLTLNSGEDPSQLILINQDSGGLLTDKLVVNAVFIYLRLMQVEMISATDEVLTLSPLQASYIKYAQAIMASLFVGFEPVVASVSRLRKQSAGFAEESFYEYDEAYFSEQLDIILSTLNIFNVADHLGDEQQHLKEMFMGVEANADPVKIDQSVVRVIVLVAVNFAVSPLLAKCRLMSNDSSEDSEVAVLEQVQQLQTGLSDYLSNTERETQTNNELIETLTTASADLFDFDCLVLNADLAADLMSRVSSVLRSATFMLYVEEFDGNKDDVDHLLALFYRDEPSSDAAAEMQLMFYAEAFRVFTELIWDERITEDMLKSVRRQYLTQLVAYTAAKLEQIKAGDEELDSNNVLRLLEDACAKLETAIEICDSTDDIKQIDEQRQAIAECAQARVEGMARTTEEFALDMLAKSIVNLRIGYPDQADFIANAKVTVIKLTNTDYTPQILIFLKDFEIDDDQSALDKIDKTIGYYRQWLKRRKSARPGLDAVKQRLNQMQITGVFFQVVRFSPGEQQLDIMLPLANKLKQWSYKRSVKQQYRELVAIKEQFKTALPQFDENSLLQINPEIYTNGALCFNRLLQNVVLTLIRDSASAKHVSLQGNLQLLLSELLNPMDENLLRENIGSLSPVRVKQSVPTKLARAISLPLGRRNSTETGGPQVVRKSGFQ